MPRGVQALLLTGLPAHSSLKGRVPFINGFLLSYPTDRDVGVEVTVIGDVPQAEDVDVMLMSVREPDNGGALFPRASSPSTNRSLPRQFFPFQKRHPLHRSDNTLASPSPTKAGGGLSIAGILAAGAGGIFYRGTSGGETRELPGTAPSRISFLILHPTRKYDH